MPFRSVPGQASVAEDAQGGKLFAPAAARNLAPLIDVLQAHAPQDGQALEIASGTGQHVSGFAGALPGLAWHPSDIDPARRASIDAYVSEAGLANVAKAVALDATAPGWGALIGPFDLIVLANLLHLVSVDETRMLLAEARQALAPGGRMLVYGPFRRAGILVSEGDQSFDAALQSHDPEIGYKDVDTVATWAASCGLELSTRVEMPAHNLTLVFQRT